MGSVLLFAAAVSTSTDTAGSSLGWANLRVSVSYWQGYSVVIPLFDLCVFAVLSIAESRDTSRGRSLQALYFLMSVLFGLYTLAGVFGAAVFHDTAALAGMSFGERVEADGWFDFAYFLPPFVYFTAVLGLRRRAGRVGGQRSAWWVYLLWGATPTVALAGFAFVAHLSA